MNGPIAWALRRYPPLTGRDISVALLIIVPGAFLVALPGTENAMIAAGVFFLSGIGYAAWSLSQNWGTFAHAYRFYSGREVLMQDDEKEKEEKPKKKTRPAGFVPAKPTKKKKKKPGEVFIRGHREIISRTTERTLYRFVFSVRRDRKPAGKDAVVTVYDPRRNPRSFRIDEHGQCSCDIVVTAKENRKVFKAGALGAFQVFNVFFLGGAQKEGE